MNTYRAREVAADEGTKARVNVLRMLESASLSLGLSIGATLLSIHIFTGSPKPTVAAIPMVAALGFVVPVSILLIFVKCRIHRLPPDRLGGHEAVAEEVGAFYRAFERLKIVGPGDACAPIASTLVLVSTVYTGLWLDDGGHGLPMVPMALMSTVFVIAGVVMCLEFVVCTYTLLQGGAVFVMSARSICTLLESMALCGAGARWALQLQHYGNGSNSANILVLGLGVASLTVRVTCCALERGSDGRRNYCGTSEDLIPLAAYSAVGYIFVQVPAYAEGYEGVSLFPVLMAICAALLARHSCVALLRNGRAGASGYEAIV